MGQSFMHLNKRQSSVADKADPFLNKRQSLPPVLRNGHDSFDPAGGLINGGGDLRSLPHYIPKNLLTDPYNQLNTPHSLRAGATTKAGFLPWSPRNVDPTSEVESSIFGGSGQSQSAADVYNAMAQEDLRAYRAENQRRKALKKQE